jgi:hypothetical protein
MIEKSVCGTEPTAESRLERHLELYDAVCRLSTIADRLDYFHNRIIGVESPDAVPENKKVAPSLSDVLNCSGEIHSLVNSIHSKISAIEESLF